MSLESWAFRWRLDPRGLAAGRIAVGLLLLVDLLQRAGDLTAHYTDQGVLPRDAYALLPWDFVWSLHTLGGSAPFEAALFVLGAVCAAGLLVGYRTFWMNVGAWILTVSLHARNPLLRDGQDDLIRVLLFWMLFLPLGEVASLDARAGRLPPAFQRARPALSLFLVAQVFVMYEVSGLGKLLSPWWLSGEGIGRALSVGRYATGLGSWLAPQPWLPPLSFAVMGLELLGPFAWLGFPAWKARTAVAAAFASLHLGFVLTMRLGLFPWVCLAAWAFLLPAGLFERLGWRSQAPPAAGTPARPPVAIAAAALALVVYCNALYLWPQLGMPRGPQRIASALGLQQYWVLFSPRQSSAFASSDGWLVASALLENGRRVDLERDGAQVDFARPAVLSASFQNARWRHYVANVGNLLMPFPRGSVQLATLEKSRAAHAKALCRDWNRAHPAGERAQSVSLFLMHYRFDQPEQPARPELLFQDACGVDGS